MSKVLLITGASRGFGRLWAEAFLERGDKVAATARNINALSDLVEKYGDQILPVSLDVNDREAGFKAVKKVKDHFGGIDVLINNAGYGLFGAIEETSEREARDQMETNFFGVLWMTQAVLPVMRQQKSGHIIQVSSVLGLITLPALGLYNASKFAVEGFTETLATEVNGFGINVSLVEPNGYATEWSGASAFRAQELEVYEPVRQLLSAPTSLESFGDPLATIPAILKLVDAPNPPLRLLMGKVAYPAVRENYAKRFEEFDAWKEISEAAHG